MNNFMCRATGITLLCLASTLSAQTQGSAAPALRGQALVKAVIALARDAEGLGADLEKLPADSEIAAQTEAKCTFKKSGDWLASEQQAVSRLRNAVELWKRAETKLKPRAAELKERLDGYRKLVQEHPEAADNPIAGIEILLQAAQTNIEYPGTRIEANLDLLTGAINAMVGVSYDTAKRCKL